VFEYSTRDFFECQKVNSDGCSCGLHVGFRPSALEYSIRDFFETQTVDGLRVLLVFLWFIVCAEMGCLCFLFCLWSRL